jgi:truncated hemoglobin YjbI
MSSPTMEIKIPKTSKKALEAVDAYQKANKEAVNLKMKRYYARVKEDPERLAVMKARHKAWYEKKKASKAALALEQ